jgi:hypothetical protein
MNEFLVALFVAANVPNKDIRRVVCQAFGLIVGVRFLKSFFEVVDNLNPCDRPMRQRSWITCRKSSSLCSYVPWKKMRAWHWRRASFGSLSW